MTAPTQLDEVDHLALAVPDVGDAVAWYRERFGCEVVYQDDTWAMVRFANIRIAFVTTGEHPPHIAFERPDAASYGELVEHRDRSASVYLQDPGGNAVEIVRPAQDVVE
jgi:catechol 2,3-dioxygenase-like lactoylglutathione lyase family enzyme